MSVIGRIFTVTRGSFHDGPGVRDVVYFKGCPLRCLWCHNPEGQEAKPQLNYASVKCMGCGTCIEVCPRSNFKLVGGQLQISYENCVGCGKCREECPTGALSLYGEAISAEKLEELLLHDIDYFQRGGGITFSGGECLLQPDFLEELLCFCAERSIHTLLETALCVSERVVRRIIPKANEIYADLKHSDPLCHRRLTGEDNLQILKNLKLLGSLGTPFSVRTPLIPECNDQWENLLHSAKIAQEVGAEKYVLLPYNPLGESKYSPIGRSFSLPSYGRQEEKTMEKLCGELNCALGTDEFVCFQR